MTAVSEAEQAGQLLVGKTSDLVMTPGPKKSSSEGPNVPTRCEDERHILPGTAVTTEEGCRTISHQICLYLHGSAHAEEMKRLMCMPREPPPPRV